MSEHKLRELRGVSVVQSGEINAQLLRLDTGLLRIQFAYKIPSFDLTPPQALALAQLLIDHATKMLQK